MNSGLTRHQLQKLLKEEKIHRITRGVYQYTEEEYREEDIFSEACAYVGKPSAVCLLSALVFYHVTDLIPNQIWLMVPSEKRTRRLDLRLLRLSNPQWDKGIIQESGYWITSLERTLIESLYYKKYLGTQTAIQAVKIAIQEKRTSLKAIFNFSINMKLDGYIQPFIEALL